MLVLKDKYDYNCQINLSIIRLCHYSLVHLNILNSSLYRMANVRIAAKNMVR